MRSAFTFEATSTLGNARHDHLVLAVQRHRACTRRRTGRTCRKRRSLEECASVCACGAETCSGVLALRQQALRQQTTAHSPDRSGRPRGVVERVCGGGVQLRVTQAQLWLSQRLKSPRSTRRTASSCPD